MKKILGFMFVLIVLTGNLISAQCPTLVWSDEFDGTELDLTKWEPQIGDGCDIGLCGWGNNELQYYKAENAVVSNGTLKIIAKKERVKSNTYTSARLRSKGLADFTFGRFEARIKLLEGQGLWPAFWMLSTNEPYGTWPQSGEIDIMELLGQDPATAYGTIHYGQPWPDNAHKGEAFNLYDGSKFMDDFHTFAVEWEPGVLRWYIDDILYSTITEADVAPENWPFDAGNKMHFLLNVAVGGTWPGDPDESTPFPSQMEVDYVRVYDLFGPSISGSRFVPFQASGEVYTINNTDGSETFNWNVPAEATIVSGAGTNSITVNWGSVSGDVTCDVASSCMSKQFAIDVVVEPDYVYESSFENFDDPANITLSSATGTLTEVSNPDPGGVNTSAVSAEYIRNIGEQYDVIAYSTSAITDASLYSKRQKKFYMDVKTAAPAGTEIIVQMESADATSTNWPTGRHSRYVGVTSVVNQWERISFSYIDSPDESTADNSIANIIVLFASNTLTGDTYYWDNFDSYKAVDGSGTSNAAPVASFTYTATGLAVDFDGSGSSDSDGLVSSYDWDFGDGSVASGKLVGHTYAASGDYTVTLTVTDDAGATGTESKVVSVTDGGNAAPVASFTYTATDLAVDFVGSGSSDSDGTIISYNWDFGDGSVGNGELVSYTYSAAGDYAVTLTVTDDAGATGTDSQLVSVTAGTTSDPVTMHVQSIVTDTEDAGAGQKRGTATVTIHNDLEGAVSNATVTATFSGTFNETISGVTGSDGTVILKTTSIARGGVTVDLCVDNVTHGTLTYNAASNDVTCTAALKSAGAIPALGDYGDESSEINIYPNPVLNILYISKGYDKIEIVDLSGKTIRILRNSVLEIDVSDLTRGTYFLRIESDNKVYSKFIIKQ